ncbi:hypothetical protein GCM10022286_01300 [Gryllotalpicola daejeonensis]|uniref:ABC transporter domain-containing protein n=1 Tax=Gryllotalpicola daejeonensis TaxID=993087 RepID=A0ABP7ZE46_9MICO
MTVPARPRPRFRSAPLRQAAVFAAVFAGVRVVYGAVFAGAGGTGIPLLSLPVISLPAPFTGVTLLGPVTADGIGRLLLTAVPFAAVILGFGVLNALWDVRPWFAAAARRGPLRSSARALVIAWQTLPALGASLRRAARAARLRGERPGPSALVPVLEDAIERAVALAASLELRGFAAARRVEGACEVPVRVADAVLIRPDGVSDVHGEGVCNVRGEGVSDGGRRGGGRSRGWTLSIPSLSLSPGTLTVLTGATGSGKSTVLDALSGLFQHADRGVQTGIVEVGGVDRAAVPPRETAGFVGAVAQRVRAGFLGETVGEEIGFALTLRGVAPVIVDARVAEVAGRLGIAHLIGRPITALSAGEAELVALAAAVVEHPTLLLVDEPLAELDASARPRVVAALAAMAHEAGVCVVVAEHRIAWFAEVADRWLAITDGELRESAIPPTALEREHHFSSRQHQRCRPGTNGAAPAPLVHSGSEMVLSAPKMVSSFKSDGGVVVEVRAVSVRHGERAAVDGVSLELREGELVALTGPNGAGKSSLLGAMALPDEAGRVFVRGDDVHALKPRARHAAVALVPELVDDLFVTDSVAAECRRGDRRFRPVVPTFERFLALLGVQLQACPGHGAAHDALAETHPRDLSGGQRLCLTVALQLAADPAVLLVDEPVRGLDSAAREQVADALARAASSGTAVLFATHEVEFAAALADRTLRLEAGRLVGLAEVAS